MSENKKALEYLVASLCKTIAYIRLVNSIKNLQKYKDVKPCVKGLVFNDDDNSFSFTNKCDNFDKYVCCNNKLCPLYELNKKHIYVNRDYDDSKARLHRVRKAFVASKIR